MSLSGTISNTAGSAGNKDLVAAYQPILLATITFTDTAHTVLRLSTHPLNTAEGGFTFPGTATVAAGDYLARLLDQNIDAVQQMSETGIDIPPTITLQIADADGEIWTFYEAALGFKGATVNLDLVLWEADTGNFSSDSYRKFTGICNSPNIDETTITLSASSKLNMQKILFPLFPVQTRCVYVFPATLKDRTDGLGTPSSPIYPCGYSADLAGGVGNNLAHGGIAANQPDSSGVAGTLTDSAGNFLQCDYTRAGCTLRGMFSQDSRSQQTGRYGGVEWDSPLWWKSKSYLQGKTISGINAQNDQRYSNYVPLVYGQIFVDGVVLNVIGDGNSTRMEVLICFGNIGNASWSANYQGGVQMVLVAGVAVPYNTQQSGGPAPADALFRWQYVNYGNRNGMANNDDDYSPTPGVAYSGLGDPYGSMAVIEVVAPTVLVSSQTVPSVQILTVGPAMRVWYLIDPGSGLTDSSVPGLFYLNQPTGGALAPLTGIPSWPATGQANPIWVLMDLLIRANWTYAQLNVPSFITAAAVANVQIYYTNNAGVHTNFNNDFSPHVRYSCSLQVTKRRTAGEVIQGVRNSCKAMLVPNDKTGLLQIFIKQTMADQQPSAIAGSNNGSGVSSIKGRDGTSATGYSAYDFDETSILLNDSGASTLKVTQRTVVNSPNSISANFQDMDNQFVVDSMTELDPIDVARAAQTVTGSVQIDGLNNFDQGQRIFETRFAETFRGNPRGDSGGTYIFTFQTTQKIAHLQVGQLGRFSNIKLGLSFQMVRVISLKPSRDHEMSEIQLQWHQDQWYTDTYGQIGSPIYSGNNKQQLSRPPFAWQPNNVGPLSSDLMIPPGTMTFGMTIVYSTSRNGVPLVALQIKGVRIVNSFSTGQAPLLALQGTTSSGGSIANSLAISAVVCPYDSSGKLAPPQVIPCVVGTPPTGSGYTVTIPVISWPPGATGYYVFAGPNSNTMTYQATATGTPSTISLTSIAPPSWGPPDPMFDHMLVRYKLQLHGGVWGAAVNTVTATTLQFGGSTWSTNQWAGYDLTVTAQYNGGNIPLQVWDLRILSNTADTLTVAVATPNLTNNLNPGGPAGYTGINVGDVCVMRTKPSTFTALTLGDANFANNTPGNSPTGLALNEGNYILRIFAGTGAGQWRNVVSNTHTVYTVDQPFNPVPDATSRFWIEDTTWLPDNRASQQQNSNPAAIFQSNINIDNYAGESMVVQAMTMDSNGNSCFEQYAPIRDLFVYGSQGTRLVTTTGPVLPTDSYVPVDATAGNVVLTLPWLATIPNQVFKFQKIDSTANTVTVQCQGALVLGVWVGDTINGSPFVTLGAQNDRWLLAVPE